jgi:acetoin:2,6-dichlorophenolindophenol oxidoreductase subunit beta
MKRVLTEINEALHRLMADHEDVYILGEDIVDPYGGAFKVTKELSSAHPDRVISTPISEAAIVGMANGMALRGKRPIVEIMFGDFTSLAFDQIINHAGKFGWMFNEQASVPVIIRTPMGAGRGYGPTHSQSIEKHFCGIPGFSVYALDQYTSPLEIYEHAYAASEPCLVIENKILYAKPLKTRDDLPRHDRPDAIILTYGGAVDLCVQAAKKLQDEELNVEVFPITKLSPFPTEDVSELAKKCSNFITVEEGNPGWGFAGECAAALINEGVKMTSLAGPDHPIPSSRNLENAAFFDLEQVCDAAVKLILG